MTYNAGLPPQHYMDGLSLHPDGQTLKYALCAVLK